MTLLRRWGLFLLACLCFGSGVLADTAENRAFNAAAEAFRGSFYDRADAEFAAFAKAHPESPRLPEANLLRAQARLQMTNYAGAIELLTAGKPAAGSWADQYLFWMAQVYLRQGDFKSAADHFAALRQEHPTSSRRLEAAISEASIRSRLLEWPRVIELLGGTNGVLIVAATNTTSPLTQQGFVLLAQAHIAQAQPALAETALNAISASPLDPVLDWQRHSLLVQLRVAAGQLPQALALSTNLMRLATNTAHSLWRPESTAIHAGLLEKLGQRDESFVAWQQNLVPGVPSEFHRQALTKVAELATVRGKPAEAIVAIEKLTADQAQSPVADIALLLLGEMRLREYAANLSAGTGAANGALLDQATASLKAFVERFPTNAFIGKAQLNLGWCLLLKTNLAESQSAFRLASEKLSDSTDHAIALFKLADVQLQLGDYNNAISNYTALVNKYADVPEARTNFIERALYQTVRAANSATNRAVATRAIESMLLWFPGGRLAERADLLYGIEVSRSAPGEALRIYEEFTKVFPGAQLLPEARLAVARSYEQQNNWTNAIAQYNAWLGTYTNHPGIERAEYSRAWSTFQAGYDTNAYALFTNFVARFPKSEFSPLCQWWVADYYFRSGQPENAERAYKQIFENTNWLLSKLTFEARMMAGRAAFARDNLMGNQSGQAAEYFTSLWNDTNCPLPLRAQALFAYGDTLMTTDTAETNRIANYEEAIRVFTRLIEMFPTNKLAVLAWGQKASCLLQWAQISQQYDAPSNAFHQILIAPGADAKARSIAKIGMAMVLERQSQQTPANSGLLLQLALDHCLDVFLGSPSVLHDGEQADPFWTQKAGIEAARIAEARGQWEQAKEIYERLRQILPVMGPRIEKSIARVEEQLAASKQPLAEKK